MFWLAKGFAPQDKIGAMVAAAAAAPAGASTSMAGLARAHLAWWRTTWRGSTFTSWTGCVGTGSTDANVAADTAAFAAQRLWYHGRERRDDRSIWVSYPREGRYLGTRGGA